MSKDILRLAAILLVICGIAAACVGTANDQTTPLIEARKAEAVREGYTQVLPAAGQLTDAPAAEKISSLSNVLKQMARPTAISTQSTRTATAVK